jgi:hypothetical protein
MFDWLVSFFAAVGVVSLIIWTVWTVLPLLA